LAAVPDAEVKAEPYAKGANKPYVVFGQTYTPALNDAPFVQRGVASWYGKKFHGQRTSSGELYDMYKMTAAHPTLPIPSYARITNVDNGNSVVVRINDRGPFHSNRIVDVSYTAALKLGLLGKGSHEVELERILPGDAGKIAAVRRNAPPPEAQSAPARPAVEPRIAALMLEDRMDDEGEGEPAAAPLEPPEPPKAGYYLQLGSFSRADKAAEMRKRLMQYGGALATLAVVQSGAVHRLFSGPFATRAAASQAAQALPVSLSLKPIVVKR
jgi:rare lipoprotein A